MNIQAPTPEIRNAFKRSRAAHEAAGTTTSSIQETDVSNLRIAVVSDAISGRNGVGTFYQDLLAQIEPSVDKIALIAPSKLRDHALERFSLPMPGDKTQRLAWPRRKEFNKRMELVRPNLIVVPSLGPFTFFAVSYARRHQIPLVVVNHTDFDHILSIYWSKLIARPLRFGLDRVNQWLCRRAVAVGVMHAGAGDAAKQAGASKVRVMATPLSQSFLTKPIQPLAEAATRAIFVGRLAKEKGIADLLATVRALPDTHFTIVGDGPLRQDVEAVAKTCPNLTYLGWLPRSGVLQEVDAADILLLPSAYETFGTVALEALARERYVIASSGCGISEWPTLASGIFVVSAENNLTCALEDLQTMPAVDRLQKARQSWDAVRDFNNQAVHEWLDFFQDAARPLDR